MKAKLTNYGELGWDDVNSEPSFDDGSPAKYKLTKNYVGGVPYKEGTVVYLYHTDDPDSSGIDLHLLPDLGFQRDPSDSGMADPQQSILIEGGHCERVTAMIRLQGGLYVRLFHDGSALGPSTWAELLRGSQSDDPVRRAKPGSMFSVLL